jgi:hypothetical protein
MSSSSGSADSIAIRPSISRGFGEQPRHLTIPPRLVATQVDHLRDRPPHRIDVGAGHVDERAGGREAGVAVSPIGRKPQSDVVNSPIRYPTSDCRDVLGGSREIELHRPDFSGGPNS